MDAKKKSKDAFLEEQMICEYKVSRNRKLLWKCEIDMLEWLEAVCTKHNLDFFLIGGSELGVVRHQGFIPWDDDIDIGMLRSDYDRFISICQSEKLDHMEIQNRLCADNTIWSNICRIRDNRTTGIVDNQIGRKCSHGAFIEVYPFDNVPNNQLIRKCYGHLLDAAITVLMHRTGQIKNLSKIAKIVNAVMKHYSVEKIDSIVYRLCTTFNGKTQYVTHATLPSYMIRGEVILKYDDVKKTQYKNFEYIKTRVSHNVEGCLKREFGSYMELPPVDERGAHHSTKVFYDPSKPYTSYKEETMNELFEKYGHLL